MRLALALRLARRGIRGGGRHFAGLAACVALGVAALVAVGTFAANLDRALGREGRALLGGDLELRTPRPPGPEISDALGPLLAAGAVTVEVREAVAMARDPEGGGALLVEVKAVGPGYPLYGRVETRPGTPLPALLGADGVLVEERLLERLDRWAGDRLVVGQATFTIRGVVLREPDRVGLLTLGPRVLMSADGLDRAGLVQFGSRVRHRILVRLPDGVAAAAAREAVARRIEDPAVRVATFEEAQPGLRRFFDQLTTYLGLVALATLLVGGLGVASAVRTLVRRQRDSLAILKCLGAESRLLVTTYLAQAVALGLAGSLAGVAVGLGLQSLVVRLLADVLPLAVETRPAAWPIARALLMGGLSTLLAALWPLGEVRALSPARLLRRDVEPPPVRPDRRWPSAAIVAVGLGALVRWQAVAQARRPDRQPAPSRHVAERGAGRWRGRATPAGRHPDRGSARRARPPPGAARPGPGLLAGQWPGPQGPPLRRRALPDLVPSGVDPGGGVAASCALPASGCQQPLGTR